MAKHIGEHCLPRTWVAWSESEVKRQPVLYRQFKVNLCYIFLVSQRIIENKIACPAGNAISSVSFLCLPCLVTSFVSKKNTNFYLISEVRKPEPLETGCYFDSRRPERTKARKFSLFDHGKSISLWRSRASATPPLVQRLPFLGLWKGPSCSTLRGPLHLAQHSQVTEEQMSLFSRLF